jgi:hypothetical protein
VCAGTVTRVNKGTRGAETKLCLLLSGLPEFRRTLLQEGAEGRALRVRVVGRKAQGLALYKLSSSSLLEV